MSKRDVQSTETVGEKNDKDFDFTEEKRTRERYQRGARTRAANMLLAQEIEEKKALEDEKAEDAEAAAGFTVVPGPTAEGGEGGEKEKGEKKRMEPESAGTEQSPSKKQRTV